MAETLFAKARVAVLGKMHSLLDRAVNTPDGYRQYIRDLETALADLRAAGDEQVANVHGCQREITRLTTEKASKQADIDLLLGDDDPSNDESALNLQMKLEEIDNQIASQQELLASAQANNTALQEAITKLDHKHAEMVTELQQMTVAVAATNAKNRAAEAAEAAEAASTAADGVSVDSIKANLQHKADVADARFDRVINGLQSSTNDEEQAAMARARAALAARRAQITGAATEQVSAPAPTATS